MAAKTNRYQTRNWTEHWRAATQDERPDATVFLKSGSEILTGIAVHVASVASSTNIGILLVDVEDVKGLRCGRWRLQTRLKHLTPSGRYWRPGQESSAESFPPKTKGQFGGEWIPVSKSATDAKETK